MTDPVEQKEQQRLSSEDVRKERRRLVAALLDAVPINGARAAFMDEPEFHAIVEVLADIWVALGPVLVQQAQERHAEMRRQLAALSGVHFDGPIP